jgi:hypothetical protein
VQPSSLVFLILIAIWAAYLLQHWVRRREHLATARSVDRFSDAMRVLERRSPLPELDHAVPRPRSYAVGPPRASHPEVVVKRVRPARPEVPADREPAPELAAESDSPVRPTRVFHVLAGVSARRVRGLSLVVSFLLALAVTPMAASSLVPWWTVPAVFGVLIIDLTWLRHAAVSGRAAARAGTHARRSAASPARADARDADYFEAEPASSVESQIQSAYHAAVAYDAQAAYDGQPPLAPETAEPVERPVVVDPSAWAPVPVPPPTYTLKAKAADPIPVPARDPVAVAAPVNELGDAECWSLDGMVYDCDLDELVERRSATGA